MTFELSEKAFQYYNICLRDWHVESGVYKIMAGASSQDIRLEKECVIINDDDYSIDEVSTKWIMQES